MKYIMPCPSCKTDREVELFTYPEVVTINEQDITIMATSYRCLICDDLFDTTDMLNANLKRAREKRKEIGG